MISPLRRFITNQLLGRTSYGVEASWWRNDWYGLYGAAKLTSVRWTNRFGTKHKISKPKATDKYPNEKSKSYKHCIRWRKAREKRKATREEKAREPDFSATVFIGQATDNRRPDQQARHVYRLSKFILIRLTAQEVPFGCNRSEFRFKRSSVAYRTAQRATILH